MTIFSLSLQTMMAISDPLFSCLKISTWLVCHGVKPSVKIDSFESFGLFHQQIMWPFFVRKFVQSQTLSREKLLKRLSYKKCARKTLMKLTPSDSVYGWWEREREIATGASCIRCIIFKKVIYHY